ncbi:MAG TPA: 4a-hydroxytetrahydrobiopterin dehydratase [Verrucomicrobiae bacterium]|nr:4a-hydroxytetrahydrobiopterin dehydratase [Verrucomicrobiae bacterium]
MPLLTKKEIAASLKNVPSWSKRRQIIRRTFTFDDFPPAITFVNRIARYAQKLNHHPDIDIRFNKVTLAVTSHDAGGLTQKDFVLAGKCDGAFLKA